MSKMTRTVAVCVIAILAVLPALAQTEEAPKPGPEHKKLDYFVGKWTGKGEIAENPFMPAGTMTSTETCEWFEGGFSVVCHSEGTGPMGEMKGLGIMGYSTEEGVYTYYGVDSGPMTMTTVSKGKVEGKTWAYTDEAKMGGKMVRSRFVLEELSPTEYTFRWEMEGEDGSWKTVMKGKSTKAK